ncbi:prostate stem cell antigen-like [Ostrea edulis]|uniref:prostate stem cell antigen-like n=1 Tax=Ostrea edulis TaxID=37623 RepID=UPI0020957CAF|nr:prostate stem cell antigen-like [Ostrea edulis]
MVFSSGLFSDVILYILVTLMNLIPSLGLQCYNCTTTWEYDTCVLHPNLSRVATCESSHNVCLVQRNETFGKFDILIRRCATSCVPHCGIWGDDIDTERCFSCCSTDLCNTDSTANALHISGVTLNIINIFLLLNV